MDLLLALARTQKVDISNISVLALAEQYLAFVDQAQKLRLELAADYLVMAAWLTFLKSKLLVPRDEEAEDEPSGEELAQQLAFRLMRLEAMRDAAAKLMTRKRLGRDVFVRGRPEAVTTRRDSQFTAELFDLFEAYAEQRKRTIHAFMSSSVGRFGQSSRHEINFSVSLVKYQEIGCSSIDVCASILPILKQGEL